MNYDIFGIALVALGIWVLYNTKKNYEDMSVTLRKNKKIKAYNKVDFNFFNKFYIIIFLCNH